MGWERRRNGKKYYYRGRRLGDRVIKDYFGCGPMAELAALEDEARKDARKEQKDRLAAAKMAFLPGDDTVLKLQQATLSRNSTVPSQMHSPAPQAHTSDLPPEVVRRVQELEAQRLLGDRSAEIELIRLIEQFPALAERCGDLGQQAVAAWTNLVAGTDMVFRAALRQKVESLRARFTVPGSDPAAELLRDRIVATWLQLSYADTRQAQHDGADHKGQDYLARRQNQAQRQHLAAIQAWRQWRSMNFSFGEAGQLLPDTEPVAPVEPENGHLAPYSEDILPFRAITKTA